MLTMMDLRIRIRRGRRRRVGTGEWEVGARVNKTKKIPFKKNQKFLEGQVLPCPPAFVSVTGCWSSYDKNVYVANIL